MLHSNNDKKVVSHSHELYYSQIILNLFPNNLKKKKKEERFGVKRNYKYEIRKIFCILLFFKQLYSKLLTIRIIKIIY